MKPSPRLILFSLLGGLASGLAASLFLFLLSEATTYRQAHLELILALPLAGLVIGWVYMKYGRNVAAGNDLVLDEIHNPKKVIPIHMAPFILVGTVITHLFGGSAGREGTAVQMGASLTDQISSYFKVTPEERRLLLMAGSGAGFGAAIGAPWAGMIFGAEVLHRGRLQWAGLFPSFIASFTAYATTMALHTPHTVYPSISIPVPGLFLLFALLTSGVLFGLSARVFILMAHFTQKFFRRFISYPPARTFLAGGLLTGLYYIEGSFKYAGLGLESIQDALIHQAYFQWPALKAVFTAITVGSGFKGGEFIPLVFVGTTLGSALGLLFPQFFQVLAGLGFASVFAAAANTPLACAVMGAEIFGWELLPYSLVTCYLAYLVSGEKGIYQSQKTDEKKAQRLVQHLRLRRITTKNLK